MNNTVSRIYVITLLLSSVIQPALTQSFPQDFDYSYRTNVLLDAGLMWNVNSTFHPLAYGDTDETDRLNQNIGSFEWIYSYMNRYAEMGSDLNKDTGNGVNLLLFPGIEFIKQFGANPDYDELGIQPFIWSEAAFRSNWYARFHLRITNVASSLPHYSAYQKGESRARAGFRSAEFDQLMFGYRNEWAIVEYGRSREIWGPVAEDNLLLAGNSPPWERLMLQLTHRSLTYRWFYGYLETVRVEEDNVHRYLVGKNLQYSNQDNLIINMGEITTLAGKDRPVDVAYLNPLAVHLEVETNRKDNDQGVNHANTSFFSNVDWLPTPKIRMTFSFALDEFQIDKEDRADGEADALGYSGQIAWTPMVDPVGVTLFGRGVRNDTYMFQHSYEYTNHVTRGEMIGHPIGNDADDLAVGLRAVFSFPVLMEFSYGRRRWGDRSLLDDPYSAYEKFPEGFRRTSFPSGEVRTNRYLSLRLNSQPLKGLSVDLQGHIDLHNSGKDSSLEVWTLNLRYQRLILFTGI